MALLRCWLNELSHRTSIRACLLLETCVLLLLCVGITKSTTQIETIDLFGYKFPSMSLGDLQAVEVLLLMVFNQSKLWILFVGLIGVTGFLETNLRSPQIELLLIRPMPRWKLLASQYTAVILMFSICIFYLSGMIWLILGVKVGVWHAGLFVGSMLLCIAYSVSLPFLLWLMIWSKRTLFALLLFYSYCFISTGLEFRSILFYPLWNNHLYHRLIDTFYYGLPQLDGMLADTANAIRHPDFWQAMLTLTTHHFLYSFIIGTCYFCAAVAIFAKNDY
jgi:hypothetical protein